MFSRAVTRLSRRVCLGAAPPAARPPWSSSRIEIAHPKRRAYYYDRNTTNRLLRDARPLISVESVRRLGITGKTPWKVMAVAAGAAVIFYFANLDTVPVSGRTRFNYYSADAVKRIAEEQYKMLLHQLQKQGVRILPAWDTRTVMVKRVMKRLIPFSGLTDEKWEVFVIDDPKQANAFVLPGGKVFVFTGILPIARSESGLAAVLGHEIAHVLADHMGEHLSREIGRNLLLYSLVLLTAPLGAGTLLLQLASSSLLDLVFERPMSRMQETEADYIGLMIMAQACYDPREAVSFWTRMDQRKEDAPPEWLSTHPSSDHRAKKMEQWLPQALHTRSESDCATTTAFADLYNRARQRGVLLRHVAW